MTPSASSFRLSRRGTRLTLGGCAILVFLYTVSATVGDIMQAADQVEDLRQSYRAATDGGLRASPNESEVSNSRGVAPTPQRLLASDKAAAIALIQQVLQKSVEPPAKLESLHILDAPDDQGLVTVRASIRIRDLAPERVLTFVRQVETTMPAIVFDDIRIAIHTRPGMFGASGPNPSMETRSADISGTVQAYAMSTPEHASSQAGEGGP